MDRRSEGVLVFEQTRAPQRQPELMALLGIVGVLCFVGCGLSETGTLVVFTKYSDTTVLANPAVVAYWPLIETGDSLPAIDRTPSP